MTNARQRMRAIFSFLGVFQVLALAWIGLWSFNAVASQAAPQPLLAESLSEADYRWIGARIYQNESASNPRYLTHWGQGEEFPSLGIGHFIWFPENVSPPFEQTFPQMVRFVSRWAPPPDWLRRLITVDTFPSAPWNSRSEFQKAQNSLKMNRLRDWLLSTQSQQARFIVASFERRWQSEIASLPLQKQHQLAQRLRAMTVFKEGMFSVIDYFNFKGIGANSKERYQGEGWGLVWVLKQMPERVFSNADTGTRLAAFIESAKQRLKLRTKLAPPERNEARWLKGWFKRLDDYQTPANEAHGKRID